MHLIGNLKKKALLPVVVFTFSKKRCEENAGTLTNLDLSTSVEKSEVHVAIERALSRLKGMSSYYAACVVYSMVSKMLTEGCLKSEGCATFCLVVSVYIMVVCYQLSRRYAFTRRKKGFLSHYSSGG